MSAACGNEAVHLAQLRFGAGWNMAYLMVSAQRSTRNCTCASSSMRELDPLSMRWKAADSSHTNTPGSAETEVAKHSSVFSCSKSPKRDVILCDLPQVHKRIDPGALGH